MKIKVTNKLHGYRDREVYVIANNGQHVRIGTAYYLKHSGWHGGGQEWSFHPVDDLDGIGFVTKTRKRMIERIEENLTKHIRSMDQESPVVSSSPIIARNIS